MKISLCSIAFRKKHKNIGDLIPIVAEMGYDGIEIWGNHLLSDDISIEEIKEKLEKYGLRVSMISPYFDFTGSKAHWEASVKTAKRFTSYASFLGSPLIRAFTGIVGSKEVTFEQRKAAIEGFKKISAIAEEKGISFALETHPCTLVDRVDSALQLLEEVEAPNLKINLDIYHLWEVYQSSLYPLNALHPYIVHIHAKNAHFGSEERKNNTYHFLHDQQAQQEFKGITPLGQGDMDYRPFLQELVARSFPGFISVEWFGEKPLESAQNELTYLRRELQKIDGKKEKELKLLNLDISSTFPKKVGGSRKVTTGC